MRRSLLALLAALASLVLAPAAHAATKGPCVPGQAKPVCHFWTGKVTFVSDGDTIDVDIDGDSRGAQHIRFTGVNAMELTRYSKYPKRRRGACSGLEATALIEGYIKRAGRRVRLSAQKPSSRTGHRLRRSVAVKAGGRWVDLGRVLMEAGYGLWLPNGNEWAYNKLYHQLAEEARAAGRGLYNPVACAGGPAPGAPLAVDVNWDADGMDEQNRNGEWVDIRNLGPTDVSLAGWWLRDSWMRGDGKKVTGYLFPSYAVVPAGGSVRLHVGCGENSPERPGRFFWCQPDSVFENADGRKGTGDGGYLFDPRGNLRASMIYPCAVACATRLQGKVRVRVQPTTPERIEITNVSGEPVDLAGHLLKLHLKGMRKKFIWGYPFGAGSMLAPGETLQVHPDGSPERSSRLDRFLGRGPYVLTDRGNVVSLRSATDVVVECTAWGRSSC
jgi:endonuclease YncB( thermonuclease family)